MSNQINTDTDKIITKLTVRLKDSSNNDYIGSGVIYYQDNFKDKVYILTASHCLFSDGDNFHNQRREISINLLKSNFSDYETIKVQVDSDLLYTSEKKDVAVLILDKKEVENIIGEIPKVSSVKERGIYSGFITKGFPKATLGEEIAVLYPTWLQHFENNRFQIQLNEAYSAYSTQGFSGSPVFLITKNEIYLYGIFTRFRPEEKGKVIYCQYVETINELLDKKYLPKISFSYFGHHGLTKDFFEKHIHCSIVGLGPRFTEELNFKLPIAKYFNDIAKDAMFFKRFFKIVDDWILNHGYGKIDKNIHLEQIEKVNKDLKAKVSKWIKELNHSVTSSIDVEWLFDELDQLDTTIKSKFDDLYQLRRDEEKKSQDTKKEYDYRYPFEKEIGRLHEISRNNNDFICDLSDKINIKLANNPFLIVKGDAGNGKSHLLGDIAKTRIDGNLPTLLLLGQNLISSKNIWENFNSELGLDCKKKELLSELNNIGKQIGSRVLVLVDAINEGGGKDLWYSRIAEFINDFREYPYTGLVLSIRTTYLDHVIPTEVLNNPNLTVIIHEGFKGNEYAALKLFCEHHGLKQPHFPILAPEFTKPLFLKLICEAVKVTPQKTFPQGFQGISNIFKIYIQSLNTKFESKRPEYKNRKIVEKAIHSLAYECFGKDRRILLLEKAIELFDEKYSKFTYLINDLIEENVFIRRFDYNYESNTNEEVIYFSYERLGDFYIAEELLNKYKTVEEVKLAFQKENEFGKLIDFNYWQHHGLLEAFAVLLPEKYNVEIFEVFDWVFVDESTDEFHRNENKDTVNEFLFDSLNWRKIESINNEKITNWFSSKNFRIGRDEIFIKLVELSPIIDHPFNSDRLFEKLKRDKMPKRDVFWQQHLRWSNGYYDSGIAYPIRRLIDWAWTPEISFNIDTETARLTGQTLVWFLASTHRKLRDQTTKALVNLLEQQPDALLAILKVFKNIDDLYILERLYAVVYGCILRTESNENIIKIANVVYNYVFKNGNPPKHILLRDYARNTIEYAVYKNPKLKFNLDLIRPPYKSKMPDYFPTEEEIEKFEINTNGPEFKSKNGRMNNLISHSVLHWDFGRYIVDSNLEHFYSVPFSFEEDYKSYLKTLNRKQRSVLSNLNSIFKTRSNFTENDFRYYNANKKALLESYLKSIDKILERSFEYLKVDFSDTEIVYLKKSIIPFLEKKHHKKSRFLNSIEKNPIKRWIVNRVFELGYNHEIHGSYDSSSESFNDRSDNKIERIGKKYQWLALFEILAMIADNYKMYDDWSEKQTFYKGPWQFYTRDIDPAFTTRNIEIEDDEYDINNFIENNNWWDNPEYNNWNQNDADWVDNLIDLPSLKEVLEKKDENSTKWLSLKKYSTWYKPKTIGQDKYDGRRKEIFYKIQAYLINKRDKEKTIKWLSQQNFWGNWMPETSSPLNLINREKFWSPAYLDIDKEKKWETIQDTNLKVIIGSTDAVGEMSDDKSGAHSYYDMPCKTLFEGMKLSYAPIDGEFKNLQQDIIVKNINYTGLQIKKNELLSFLANNKLDIIWTVLGEKLSYDNRDDVNYFKELSGVYYLEENEIKGKMTSFDKE
ncbi:AVAST type 2 anti-phage system protein Avs2 [Flavobacterium sp. XS2P14]|uniref:AVAST type 2 anti-phage system protein Avs2 n=1 Tax=Flavobacterium sp. XS2P14 TaxID=3401735 RepID=UPI003AAE3DAB